MNNLKRKINKKILFLTAYAILMLLFFLYARFPGKAVGDYILAVRSERCPGMFLSFGSTTLAFPPGLKMKNVSFGFRNNSEANLFLDSLTVRPYFFGYISGRPSLCVKARAYDGNVKGIVPLPSHKERFAKTEIIFDGLNLGKCAFLKDGLGRRVTGKMWGSVVYGSSARLNFIVRNGGYQLLESRFGLNRLDFDTVEGQIGIRGNMLRIDKLKLKGNKVNCSIKGAIVLGNIIRNSEVGLSGTMEIAGTNKRISILITGTIGNAAIRYI